MRWILLLYLLVLSTLGYAEASDTTHSSLVKTERSFNEEAMEGHKENERYDYGRTQPVDNRLNDWYDERQHKKEKEVDAPNVNGRKILYYTTAIALILGLVLYLVGIRPRGLVTKNEVLVGQRHVKIEDIQTFNPYDEAVKAGKAGRFRLAIRYMHLAVLKQMAQAEYIRWSPEYTNRQYIRMLANQPFQKEFAQLTRRFEYIWYGHEVLDKETYQQLMNRFQAFKKEVSNG